MESEKHEEELEPSELGTKEYWDKTYDDDLKNFKEGGLIDEGWFGEESGLRIIKWICSSELVKKDDKIVDLGCGNGVLLLELAREGFSNLTGYDYSPSATELARVIAVEQDVCISYETVDILTEELSSEEFDVALDKGTYDAISLYPGKTRENRLQYISNICDLLKPGGLFVITSCNWTEKELLSHFEEDFTLLYVIPTPTFKFGGTTGNIVTSLVFKRK